MSLKELLLLHWAHQTTAMCFFFCFFFSFSNRLTSRNFFSCFFHFTVFKQTNNWKFMHRNL